MAEHKPTNFITITSRPEGVMVETYVQDERLAWIMFGTPEQAFRVLESHGAGSHGPVRAAEEPIQ